MGGRRQTSHASQITGRKTGTENLARTPRPSTTPNNAVRARVGRSAQRIEASAPAAVKAVAAISVVTRPACASTGGMVVKTSSAASAAGPPAMRRVQRKTMAQASQNRGRMAAREMASMRS